MSKEKTNFVDNYSEVAQNKVIEASKIKAWSDQSKIKPEIKFVAIPQDSVMQRKILDQAIKVSKKNKELKKEGQKKISKDIYLRRREQNKGLFLKEFLQKDNIKRLRESNIKPDVNAVDIKRYIKEENDDLLRLFSMGSINKDQIVKKANEIEILQKLYNNYEINSGTKNEDKFFLPNIDNKKIKIPEKDENIKNGFAENVKISTELNNKESKPAELVYEKETGKILQSVENKIREKFNYYLYGEINRVIFMEFKNLFYINRDKIKKLFSIMLNIVDSEEIDDTEKLKKIMEARKYILILLTVLFAEKGFIRYDNDTIESINNTLDIEKISKLVDQTDKLLKFEEYFVSFLHDKNRQKDLAIGISNNIYREIKKEYIETENLKEKIKNECFNFLEGIESLPTDSFEGFMLVWIQEYENFSYPYDYYYEKNKIIFNNMVPRDEDINFFCESKGYYLGKIEKEYMDTLYKNNLYDYSIKKEDYGEDIYNFILSDVGDEYRKNLEIGSTSESSDFVSNMIKELGTEREKEEEILKIADNEDEKKEEIELEFPIENPAVLEKIKKIRERNKEKKELEDLKKITEEKLPIDDKMIKNILESINNIDLADDKTIDDLKKNLKKENLEENSKKIIDSANNFLDEIKTIEDKKEEEKFEKETLEESKEINIGDITAIIEDSKSTYEEKIEEISSILEKEKIDSESKKIIIYSANEFIENLKNIEQSVEDTKFLFEKIMEELMDEENKKIVEEVLDETATKEDNDYLFFFVDYKVRETMPEFLPIIMDQIKSINIKKGEIEYNLFGNFKKIRTNLVNNLRKEAKKSLVNKRKNKPSTIKFENLISEISEIPINNGFTSDQTSDPNSLQSLLLKRINEIFNDLKITLNEDDIIVDDFSKINNLEDSFSKNKKVEIIYKIGNKILEKKDFYEKTKKIILEEIEKLFKEKKIMFRGSFIPFDELFMGFDMNKYGESKEKIIFLSEVEKIIRPVLGSFGEDLFYGDYLLSASELEEIKNNSKKVGKGFNSSDEEYFGEGFNDNMSRHTLLSNIPVYPALFGYKNYFYNAINSNLPFKNKFETKTSFISPYDYLENLKPIA